MATIEKFRKRLKLTYPNDNYKKLTLEKTRMLMDENIKKVSSGISEDIDAANLIGEIFDESFNKRFLEIMTDNLQEAFKEKNNTSELINFEDMTVTSKTKTAEYQKTGDFSRIIQELKAIVAVAFTTETDKAMLKEMMAISPTEPIIFFSKLKEFLQKRGGQAVEKYVKYCDYIKQGIEGTVVHWDNKYSKTENLVNQIYGSMLGLVGEGLWEAAAVKGRELVAEEYKENIENKINKIFETSGATVSFSGSTTGSNTVSEDNSKQQVGDSLFSISITGGGKNIQCVINVYDTTKFSVVNSLTVSPTKEFNSKYDLSLGALMKEVEVYDYWKERMQPWLIGPSPDNRDPKPEKSDNLKWIDTKQRILTKYMYDIIAVRSGGSNASTMTISGKMTTLDALISKYWDYLGDGLSKKGTNSRGIRYNIYSGYQEYYNYQQKPYKERKQSHESYFFNTWKTIETTKINISVNAMAGF